MQWDDHPSSDGLPSASHKACDICAKLVFLRPRPRGSTKRLVCAERLQQSEAITFPRPILIKLCERSYPHLKQEPSLRSKGLPRIGCLAHRSHCPLQQPRVISWPHPCVLRQLLVSGGLAFPISKSGEMKEQIHTRTEMMHPRRND